MGEPVSWRKVDKCNLILANILGRESIGYVVEGRERKKVREGGGQVTD